MNKKYEIFKENEMDELYRIRALRDFSNVKTGDIGGYIEKEENLSHDGNCWIYDNGKVFGDAKVYGNAFVTDRAKVHGRAEVFGDANIHDNAEVYNQAKVYGTATIRGKAEVFEFAKVYGYSYVNREACVYGNAEVYGHSIITDHAEVRDEAILNDAILYGRSVVCKIR